MVIRRYLTSCFLFKGTYLRAVFNRERRRCPWVPIPFPTTRSTRYAIGNQLRRCNGNIQNFAIQVRPRRQVLFYRFSLPRILFLKRTRKLFRTRERDNEVMMEVSVRDRTTALYGKEFFRYGNGQRRKLMTLRHRAMNINVGRNNVTLPLQHHTIKRNGRCPCLNAPSTKATRDNGNL